MKFLDSHYEEYIQAVNNISLHPTLTKKLQSFPDNLNQVKNVIFYGPSGVGKYSQVLNCIKKYSNSELAGNTWYHVAGIIRGPTDMDIYINGVQDVGSYDGSGSSLRYSAGNATLDGKSITGTLFSGDIDEPMFFNRALTADEVKELYEGDKPDLPFQCLIR